MAIVKIQKGSEWEVTIQTKDVFGSAQVIAEKMRKKGIACQVIKGTVIVSLPGEERAELETRDFRPDSEPF